MEILIKELKLGKFSILNNINISARNGEVIHIIGRNGVGKSTLFKAMLGEHRYNGHIDIEPKDIAIISDYASIPRELLVKDIVIFLHKYHKNYSKDREKKLYEITQIDKILNNKIANLSSGEKRKLEIYSTLFSGKKVVIFDEVTNALDRESKENIINLIREIRKELKDLIIFYTSHDMREVIDLKGRKIFINKDKNLVYEKIINTEEELIKEYMYG